MLVAFEWNVLCIYLTYNLTVVHICCFHRKNACLVRIWVNWQLRSNQSDVHVRELVINLCIVYFWYCGTWIGFKFEDDTNCDGEFDYYAIMYLYINWCVNACIYIRFVNFVTIFPPEKLFTGLPLIYKGTIFLSFCMECSLCRMSVYCFFKGTFIQVYGRPYHIFFSEMQHVFAVFAKLHVTCLKFFFMERLCLCSN